MTEIFNTAEQASLRRKLRHTMSKGETVLWKHIKGSQLGFKFRRQCSIGPYVADFYCPQIRLVVEVDGLTHYSLSGFARDQKRDAYFQSLGLTVKRYNTDQVFHFTMELMDDLRYTCRLLQERATTPSPISIGATPPSKGGDSDKRSQAAKDNMSVPSLRRRGARRSERGGNVGGIPTFVQF